MAKVPMIIKSNKLIESSYKLSVSEQRIILTLATRINFDDENFNEYVFSIKELLEITGIKGNSQYEEIRKTTLKLMTGVQYRQSDGKIIQVPWLTRAEYSTPGEDATVTLRFDDWLREFLLQLKTNFTKYRLENVIRLTSKYSFRLYELLKQYQKIGSRTIPIEQLRHWLYVEDGEYQRYGDFRRNVIDTSQRELADKSDICFEFEEIRPSKKVTAIKFIIKLNQKKTKDEIDLFSEHYKEIAETLREPVDPIEELLEKTVIRLKEEFKFKTVTVNSIVKKYELNYINENLDIAIAAYKAGKADDLQAFTRAALRDDYRKQLSYHEVEQKNKKEQLAKAVKEVESQVLEQTASSEDIQHAELQEFLKRVVK